MPLAQGLLTFLVLQNLLVSASASCLAAALAFSLTGCVQVFCFRRRIIGHVTRKITYFHYSTYYLH